MLCCQSLSQMPTEGSGLFAVASQLFAHCSGVVEDSFEIRSTFLHMDVEQTRTNLDRISKESRRGFEGSANKHEESANKTEGSANKPEELANKREQIAIPGYLKP